MCRHLDEWLTARFDANKERGGESLSVLFEMRFPTATATANGSIAATTKGHKRRLSFPKQDKLNINTYNK